MVKLSSNNNAVSAVVGALMIVVITVAAASAFAVFTSQKQAEIQKADLLKTQQSLENIKVISITPTINTTDSTKWLKFDFTIANISPEQSTVINVLINNHQLKQFNVLRYNETLHNYTTQRFNIQNFTFQTLLPTVEPLQNGALILYEQEQITISVNISNDSFDSTTILSSDVVKLELVTKFGNSFSRVFIPPTAIIKIDTESLPNATSYYILDGSASDHPGDGYIIKWNWTVTDISNTFPNNYLHGRKAQFIANGLPGDYYQIDLTVTDNYGMKGMSSFKFQP
jgi:hypothetical protein